MKKLKLKNKSKNKKMSVDDLAAMMFKNFATKEDLKNFATKEDLKNFATKEDLLNAQNSSLVFMEQLESNILGAFKDVTKSNELRFVSLEKRVGVLESKIN